MNTFLFHQNFSRICHATDQFCHIKTLHDYLIVAKFQLIQSQEFLDHTIHFICLINNNITVKLSTFRVIIDAFLKTFRIALNQCQRCL